MPSLVLSVLICGLVSMALELAASRALAPFFGGTLTVWTSIIGICLGSMSAGYLFGGHLSRKGHGRRALPHLTGGASLYLLIIALSAFTFLTRLQNLTDSLSLGSFIACIVLFSPPTLLLSAVVPIAVELWKDAGDEPGRAAGIIYAISTFGSIAGTFLSGFVLLPSFGTRTTLIILALLLLIPTLSFSRALLDRIGIAILATSSLIISLVQRADARIIETPYSTFFIQDELEHSSGRTVRYLQSNPFAIQSGAYLTPSRRVVTPVEASLGMTPSEIPLPYARYFNLVKHFAPHPEHLLMIGGGVFSWPKSFLHKELHTTIDVVEIDPFLPRIAEERFGFTPDTRLNIITNDGRVALRRASINHYDAIIIDAFTAPQNIPAHLLTREFFQEASAHLTGRGVIILNIISAYSGAQSKLLEAVFATVESVFPEVLVFSVSDVEKREEVQNLILVAMRSPVPPFNSTDPEMSHLLSHQRPSPPTRTTSILTDDFSPVESMTNSLYARAVAKLAPLR